MQRENSIVALGLSALALGGISENSGPPGYQRHFPIGHSWGILTGMFVGDITQPNSNETISPFQRRIAFALMFLLVVGIYLFYLQ